MRSVLIALGWGDYRIVSGIARYAAEHDWHLSTQMLFTPQVLSGWQGDGAIVSYDQRLAKLIVGLDMPCVDLTPVEMPVTVPRVLVDNEAIGQQAAEHLLACGFRTFAFFGQKGVWASAVRGRAFTAALHARGVAVEGVHSLTAPADRFRDHWPEYERAAYELLVLGGTTEHPHEDWMQQVARNVTDSFDGPLLEAKYLIHDRDGKYTASLDRIMSSVGIKPIKLPARSPDLNAYAERFLLARHPRAPQKVNTNRQAGDHTPAVRRRALWP